MITAARELRDRLRRAKLLLLFTPELCGPGRDPLEILDDALPHVDAVQVRIKDPHHPRGASPARPLFDWTRRLLGLLGERPLLSPLVLVNDRVDVAAALGDDGVHGVHLGTDDMLPSAARSVLGETALLGVSTHTGAQVLQADAEPVDYVGFGPVHPTATKGYEEGLGAEAAWIASAATPLPVFPIGGIDLTNAAELSHVGRAAVSAAILGAREPGATARALRLALG